MSDSLRYTCTTCGVPAGVRCRTLKTKRTTDYHEARTKEAFVAWMKGVNLRRDWTAPPVD